MNDRDLEKKLRRINGDHIPHRAPLALTAIAAIAAVSVEDFLPVVLDSVLVVIALASLVAWSARYERHRPLAASKWNIFGTAVFVATLVTQLIVALLPVGGSMSTLEAIQSAAELALGGAVTVVLLVAIEDSVRDLAKIFG